VLLTNTLRRRLPPDWGQWVARCCVERDLLETCALFGRPTADTSFVVWLGHARSERFDRALRDALQRVRTHVEAALRLRFAAQGGAIASVTLDGRVEYLDSASLVGTRSDRLTAWRALVDGHWSLVEQAGRDGGRSYLALVNPPNVRLQRALGEREASIVELSARGLSNNHVADTLGISASRVSSVLASVARRMGFKLRADLVRFAAHSLGAGATMQSSGTLTPAEVSVLELVQRGLSNHAIATLRGTSERTVANQVAALLRKTGVNTRRALLVMDRAENT
jgi:DNA-binding NarL/FixJ family response regulator